MNPLDEMYEPTLCTSIKQDDAYQQALTMIRDGHKPFTVIEWLRKQYKEAWLLEADPNAMMKGGWLL